MLSASSLTCEQTGRGSEGTDWEFDWADWEFDGADWEFDGARPDIRANRRTRRDGRNLCEKKERKERL